MSEKPQVPEAADHKGRPYDLFMQFNGLRSCTMEGRTGMPGAGDRKGRPKGRPHDDHPTRRVADLLPVGADRFRAVTLRYNGNR